MIRALSFQYRLRTLFLLATLLAGIAYLVAARNREIARERLKSEAKQLEAEILIRNEELNGLRSIRTSWETRNQKMLDEHEGKPELFISDAAYELFMADLMKPIRSTEAKESALLQAISELKNQRDAVRKQLGGPTEMSAGSNSASSKHEH